MSLTTPQDTVLQAQLSTDATGAVTYSIALQPLSGALALDASSGKFSYTPKAAFVGVDQFTYRARDSSNNLAASVVTITVTRANKAPTLAAILGPKVVDAGASFDVTLQAHDADGSIAGFQLEQTSGEPLTRAQITGQTLSIEAPDSPVAMEVSLEVTALDNEGATATATYTFTIAPASSSGTVHTLVGGADRGGIHWVITGDGYAKEEQGKLVGDALAVARYVLDTPIVSSYAAVWNVHVINAVSEQSGVDVPWEGIAVNTAFDGRLGCNGIARALCMNDAKVLSAIQRESIEADFVLVLSNTDRYGGATGSIATATTNSSAPFTVLHEMGHHFAGLGDEYVDAQAADIHTVYYEGLYPNVTQQVTIDAIPWRLWIPAGTALPTAPTQAGVGLFEGANYSPTGFYRPTADSFMRSAVRDLGPVNGEVWAIANYVVAGPVQRSAPVDPLVTTTQSSPVQLEVRPTFGPLQQIRWAIDGVAQSDQDNRPRISCCTSPGTHLVTVVVFDGSGIIRSTDSRTVYSRAWEVTVQP